MVLLSFPLTRRFMLPYHTIASRQWELKQMTVWDEWKCLGHLHFSISCLKSWMSMAKVTRVI